MKYNENTERGVQSERKIPFTLNVLQNEIHTNFILNFFQVLFVPPIGSGMETNMDELEKLYTVEDIANMTGLTTRTIRNYLKDGTLEGNKIGGQWRFTMKNIKNLFNSGNVAKDIQDNKRQQVLDFIDGVNTDIKGSIQVCTIVDYYCETVKNAKEMSNKLETVINNNELSKDDAKYSYEYIEKEGKARFVLFGNPSFIINALKTLEK